MPRSSKVHHPVYRARVRPIVKVSLAEHRAGQIQVLLLMNCLYSDYVAVRVA